MSVRNRRVPIDFNIGARLSAGSLCRGQDCQRHGAAVDSEQRLIILELLPVRRQKCVRRPGSVEGAFASGWQL